MADPAPLTPEEIARLEKLEKAVLPARRWSFHEATSEAEFLRGTRLPGSLVAEDGTRFAVIGSDDAVRIAGLLSGDIDAGISRLLATVAARDATIRELEKAVKDLIVALGAYSGNHPAVAQARAAVAQVPRG